MEEFSEFLAGGQTPVPRQVSDPVSSTIRSLLNPSPWTVFGKIALIQSVVGGVSLLFCPQFGVSLTSSMGLMQYLMKYGESVCMLGCGAFFTGASFLVGAFALRPEEVRVLRHHQLLQLTSLATLTIGAFLCLGGDIIVTFAFVWILGALLGGAATLELGWKVRAAAIAKV